MRPTGVSLSNPVHLLAVGFGSGLAPRAPGTWGTLAAIPLFLLLDPLPPAAYWGVLLFAFGIGVWVCGLTAKAMGVDDHPAIVWDEVVGFLVAMGASSAGIVQIAAGFALFRVLDIWKPWPIGLLDRELHGGLGIMLDDVIAGFLVLLVMAAGTAVLA